MRTLARYCLLTVLLAGLALPACQRQTVNPTVEKSVFGKRIFAVVKNLNMRKPIASLKGVGTAAPVLSAYATSVTDRQFEVRYQKVDPFAGSGSVVIVSQKVVFAKGKPPVLLPDRQFKLYWVRGNNGWEIDKEEVLK